MDAASQEYLTLAEGANRDYAQLLKDKPDEAHAAVKNLRELWVEGNPLYERMEGIVAGVPSLATYDVDHRRRHERQGGSRERRAVRPRARRRPHAQAARRPLQHDGGRALGHDPRVRRRRASRPTSTATARREFGEVLPDADVSSAAAATSSTRYATELQADGQAWQPSDRRRVHRAGRDGADDERVLRPVEGVALRGRRRRPPATTFNVVSRLSDIHDILAGLQVVYDDVEPVDRRRPTPPRRSRPARELDGLTAFIEGLYGDGAGRQALHAGAGRAARQARRRTRSTAIAGQVSQAAATLGIEIGAVAGRGALAPGRGSSLRLALALPATAAAAAAALAGGGRPARAASRDAESALVLENPAGADGRRGARAARLRGDRRPACAAPSPAARRSRPRALARGRGRRRARRLAGLVEARADAWTALLAGGAEAATAAAKAGDAATARRWLLVREFRPPTRFSRARRRRHAGAALAGARQARARDAPPRRVRADLLDTYQARLLRRELEAAGKATRGDAAAARCRRPRWRAATGTCCSPPTARSAAPRPTAATAALFDGRCRGEPRRGAPLARGARLAGRLPRRAARARPGAAPRRPGAPLHRRSCPSSTAAASTTAASRATSRSRRRSRSATAPPSAFADLAPRADAPRRGRDAAAHAARSTQLGVSSGGRRERQDGRRSRRHRSAQADAIIDADRRALPDALARSRRDRRLRRHRGHARPAGSRPSRRGPVRHAPSRRASRPTRSSSSGPSSACAAWRPTSSRGRGLLLVRRGRQGRPRAADRPPRLDRRESRATRAGARPARCSRPSRPSAPARSQRTRRRSPTPR